MVGPSKILTVSYGTFSCTLEGFDDPFSTMRGIAEYFRDLAADDRYFGAEPPTPDAEMLHRIAEKEIQRKVESSVSPTGIVLRQADDAVEDTAPAAVAEVAPTAEVAQFHQPAPQPATADMSGTATVAERLARIRGVVAQSDDDFAEEEVANAPFDHGAEDNEEAAAEQEEVQDEAVAEDKVEDVTEDVASDAGDVEEEVHLASEEELVEEVAEDEAFEDAASDDADDLDHEDVVAEAEAEAVAEVENEFEDDDISVDTDVLSNILAAQDGTDEDAVEDEATFEVGDDESVDEEEIALGDAVEAADADIDQEVAEFDVDEPLDLSGFDLEADEASEVAPEVDLSAIAEEVEEAAETSDEATGVEAETAADLAEEPSSFAALIAAEKELAETEVEDVEAEDEDDDEDGTVSRLVRMRLNDVAAQPQETVDETTQEAEPFRLDDALAGDEVDSNESYVDTPAAIESSLSDEDERALQEELASLNEAVVDEDFDDEVDEVEDDEDDEASAEVSNENVRPGRPTTRPEGVRVERLLEVTNNEMADGEGSRRRSAIAHLKAAVAATRADREAMGQDATNDDEVTEPDDISSYRDDLARVVRPRRLADGARNMARRLAPLVLVSEQRIEETPETEEPTQSAVIRPRRISGKDAMDEAEEDGENIFSEAGSFAEFARDMGATELPDLLEAAAAYYHFVEGQPHFSRPQVMNAVAAVGEDAEFSREEGLRSFGMLLRRGKFRKIRRGQFEIAESTRFRPELQAGE